MAYDAALIAQKLRRWEKYLVNYTLPTWQELPDFGLYMEQVLVLMKQYLAYLPPELSDEELITPATINNYVRKKIMPEPVKKRYYRVHLAYLLLICSLKQSLSIADVQKLLPNDLPEADVQALYAAFVDLHHRACVYYVQEVRAAADDILHPEKGAEVTDARVADLIMQSALVSGFSQLMAEKLLTLEGVALADVPAGELAAGTHVSE